MFFACFARYGRQCFVGMARNGRQWFCHSVAVGIVVNGVLRTLWVGSWVLFLRGYLGFASCVGICASRGFLRLRAGFSTLMAANGH